MESRRDFLKGCALSGISALGLNHIARASSAALNLDFPLAAKKLKILVIGGTRFLGPPAVEYAVARGHEVTLFNRGKSSPHLFPKLEKLRGDRNGDLSPLKGRVFDVVIDTCGYWPEQLEKTCGMLKECGHYIFVSSVSAYRDLETSDCDEKSAVGTLSQDVIDSVKKIQDVNKYYGPLKAACEAAAEKILAGRVSNIRPGLIVGRGDRTDRFTYWPTRVARGGDILAPGQPHHTVQFIDVRDLAEWMIRVAETKPLGVVNATGPTKPLTMKTLLETCKKVSASDATFHWPGQEFLKAHKVQSWKDMPVYMDPIKKTGMPPVVSNALAIKAGLTFRPLNDTIADTIKSHAARVAKIKSKYGKTYRLRAGISPQREEEVLKAWREASQKKAETGR